MRQRLPSSMSRGSAAALLAAILCISLISGCGGKKENTESAAASEAAAAATTYIGPRTEDEERAYIEETLNLSNNTEQTWSFNSNAWTLSVVSAVVYPEIENEQGVSVCVPAAYVSGIDTDGDGQVDVTSDNASGSVTGSLVIDYDAEVTGENGQTYTASTAPIILNTGAAGYGSSSNMTASSSYAPQGYINVSCGNRGKQDTATDEDGNTYYTGDAPCCLVDQKNAARFVKYNILLGNLPGNPDYLVSTGGSGGAAFAAMFAATSNNPDFYEYEIEAGAVGVYRNGDGTYTTSVNIDGTDYAISDGAWGCIAYSAITSLAEADMAMAFEYYMDPDYDFGSDFQAQLAEYLSASYMEYINSLNLSVDEEAVGFDLNGDGDKKDTVDLTIEYDPDAHPETNGYYGSYLDLYLAEFISNLQWYLDNLDYGSGWTWFDSDGNALSDEAVAAMSTEDKAVAFIEGRYTAGSAGGMGDMGGPADTGGAPGDTGGDMGGAPGDMGDMGGPGDTGGDMGGGPGDMGDMGGPGDTGSDMGGDTGGDANSLPDNTDGAPANTIANENVAENSTGDERQNGGPEAGSTQAAGSSSNSSNYSSFDEMLSAYQDDIASIAAGDEYGKNLVDLYNPINYIGASDTEDPAWVHIIMGAKEGDISMFNSLNLEIAFLNAGTDANIEWQWNGGHVPSEILSGSFTLYVDQMYGEYSDTGKAIETPAAEAQTSNGSSTSASGTDISSWVNYDDPSAVSFSLTDALSYRASGASKAIPGFDVIDYGQEDYVFGNESQDARHWDSYVLEALEEYRDVLESLF